jgi:DNA-binding NtrC family response regulator
MGGYTFLLVDDEETARSSISRFFAKKGHVILEADSVARAQSVLRSAKPDAAILDYQLPDGDGLELLRALRGIDSTIPVVMLTGHGSIELAVRAIKEGAEQFLTKPVELPALLIVAERLVEHRRNRQSVLAVRARESRDTVDPFLGDSPAIKRLADQAGRIAARATTVLLQGPSGSGKGVLAAWLHRNGPRREETFVDLNCAGLARDLLESELFGHEKGAFTGAVSSKTGLLEVAHRGTLFLDEIGDTELAVQSKLLKVLEEQRFRRLGDTRDRQVDVRLIAATHRDLKEHTRNGHFREDLYFRISAIPLFVPPLRDRGGDVIVLARAMLRRIRSEVGIAGGDLSAEVERLLLNYDWPGNIRELHNVMERAVLLGPSGEVTVDVLSEVLAPRSSASRDASLKLVEAEKSHIEAALEQHTGDVAATAAALGLSRSALYQKIKKHEIETRRHRR